MEPGSALFLPRGYWHSSLALEDSLAITFTLCSRTWLEVIWEKLREEILQSEDWRKLAVGFGKGETTKEHMEIVTQLMEDLKTRVDSISPQQLAEHAARSDHKRQELEHAALETKSSNQP